MIRRARMMMRMSVLAVIVMPVIVMTAATTDLMFV
jgi:hypothetical protein